MIESGSKTYTLDNMDKSQTSIYRSNGSLQIFTIYIICNYIFFFIVSQCAATCQMHTTTSRFVVETLFFCACLRAYIRVCVGVSQRATTRNPNSQTTAPITCAKAFQQVRVFYGQGGEEGSERIGLSCHEGRDGQVMVVGQSWEKRRGSRPAKLGHSSTLTTFGRGSEGGGGAMSGGGQRNELSQFPDLAGRSSWEGGGGGDSLSVLLFIGGSSPKEGEGGEGVLQREATLPHLFSSLCTDGMSCHLMCVGERE